MNQEFYDSRIDTTKHIKRVQSLLNELIMILKYKSWNHDSSKLESPEREIFDFYTSKLKSSTYGSSEYFGFLSEMKVSLDHHYSCNSHHPEHFTSGIEGMNLIDLIEMTADWFAASERHSDGDIYRSLEINKKRFGISDQLSKILFNTVKLMEKKVK